MAVVYRHIRLDKNEPFYIGIGASVKRAYSKHGRSKYWKSVAKVGYEIDVLFEDLTWEEACKKEIEFISMYGRVDLKTGTLVNMTAGGDGALGRPQTDRLKKILRESPNMFSIAQWTRLNGVPNKGKKHGPHTEERNLKASIALKQVWATKSKEPISKRMKASNPTFIKKECEYCNQLLGLGGYARWHGKNCKNKK